MRCVVRWAAPAPMRAAPRNKRSGVRYQGSLVGSWGTESIVGRYGDTALRARLASVELSRMGLDVPVYRECEQPTSGKAVVWGRHEGHGVPDPRPSIEVVTDLDAEGRIRRS